MSAVIKCQNQPADRPSINVSRNADPATASNVGLHPIPDPAHLNDHRSSRGPLQHSEPRFLLSMTNLAIEMFRCMQRRSSTVEGMFMVSALSDDAFVSVRQVAT